MINTITESNLRKKEWNLAYGFRVIGVRHGEWGDEAHLAASGRHDVRSRKLSDHI